mmetsp:Transcript_77456/g.128021  ORF Transcript_77456/g.128021 Transcript_77456/m.128021 type:complete len:229 (-) Transcript_77456:530-1216(-)
MELEDRSHMQYHQRESSTKLKRSQKYLWKSGLFTAAQHSSSRCWTAVTVQASTLRIAATGSRYSTSLLSGRLWLTFWGIWHDRSLQWLARKGWDGMCQHHISKVVHQFQLDCRFRERQVKETILSAVIPLWAPFRCDSATSSCDQASQLPRQELKLLLMDMPGDEKVQPVGTQLGVPRELVTTREVGDSNLPAGCRSVQFLLHPGGLPFPKISKPGRAFFDRARPPSS